MEHNQSITGDGRYVVDPQNEILSFFLKPASRAYGFSVYRSFGDYALELLDDAQADLLRDPYNRPLGTFLDGRNCDPIRAVIRFFDVMLQESAHQDVRWHMWLFYFPSMASRVVRNIRLRDSRVDLSGEFWLASSAFPAIACSVDC